MQLLRRPSKPCARSRRSEARRSHTRSLPIASGKEPSRSRWKTSACTRRPLSRRENVRARGRTPRYRTRKLVRCMPASEKLHNHLSRFSIRGEQLLAGFTRQIPKRFECSLDCPWNVTEANLSRQKQGDGLLVRGIVHRRRRAAPAARVDPHLERREAGHVNRLEGERRGGHRIERGHTVVGKSLRMRK